MNLRFVGLVSAAVSLCLAVSASGQVPYVVTNVPSPTAVGANAVQFTAVGDAVYFYADPTNDAAAIWKWTEAGGAVKMLTVVQETNLYYTPSLMAFGDKLLFSARTNTTGHELWISDGTPGGTTLLKDIYPNSSSYPAMGIVSNGKAYFSAIDPDHGRELWVTDGTPGGTVRVADLAPDVASSYPLHFAERNGLVYFTALEQLWVTDGTAAGTVSLATGVHRGVPGVLSDRVVFLGADGTNGRELWQTDGTVAGTALVKDINPGLASSWGGIGTAFVPNGGSLLFFAEDAATGRELWITDGTSGGTQLVKDVTPGEAQSQLERLVAADNGAYFVAGGTTLWFSDGTDGGTIPLATYSSVVSMAGAPNGAYLIIASGPGRALAYSDGTVAGTVELPDVLPLTQLYSTGGQVFFSSAGNNSQPWITDGTEAGTHELTTIPITTGYAPAWMMAAGNYAFFPVGDQLYRSDGTAPGTIHLGGITNEPYYYPTRRTVLGNLFLYFHYTTAPEARGLWKSDGTVAGTTVFKPFYSVDLIAGTSFGYALVWGYETSSGSPRLWRTDGTAAGTSVLSQSNNVNSITEYAGHVYFLAGSCCSPGGAQLWRTGGTAASTRIVMTGEFESLATAGGALYVVKTTSEAGRELWKTDGTAEGMTLVKDIVPGTGSSSPELLKAVGNVLLFTASTATHGRELWRTDGTEAGTFLLKDIQPGNGSPYIVSGMTESGMYAYFAAEDTIRGRELWRTDGTVAGTIVVTDLSSVIEIGAADGKVVFNGAHTSHGFELWESDGSPAGTFLVGDLVPGELSSSPARFTLAGNLLFFVTNDGRLWARQRAASRLRISDRVVTEGNAGSSILVFTVTREGDLSGTASVDYVTADLTATAGQDYQSTGGTLPFAAGEASKLIPVLIFGDTDIEQNESFAVTLSGATGAALVRSHATGTLEENDRQVALSIELRPAVSSYDNRRTFRISNAGPSMATVTLNVSESPYESTFSCDGRNPSVCNVGAIAAGSFVDYVVHRSTTENAVPGATLPGRTITATVSAAEAETDLTDNTIARMLSNNGLIVLPSYLVAGTSAVARVSSGNLYFGPQTVSLSLTGDVVVSPSSAVVSEAQPVASFDLTVAPSAWGWSSVLQSGSAIPAMRIPIVLQGEHVKLDTTIVPPYRYSYGYFDFDEPIELPVRVAAVLPDGTRPSGTVSLRNQADDSLVQAQPLDAESEATFVLTGLPVGRYDYRIVYSGDDDFHALSVDLGELIVQGRPTSTNVLVQENPCGVSQIVVSVTSSGGPTPAGTVTVSIGSTQYPNLPLIASATPGEATAAVNHTFTSTNYTNVNVVYTATSPFMDSSDWYSFYPVNCPAPTLIASAASTTSVSLLWSSVGAHSYEILRAAGPSLESYSVITTTAGTSFTDTTAQPGRAYLYKINAKNSAGVVRSTSAADLATTIVFTDDPIVFRSTRVKAVHITEIRNAVNALRTLAGQTAIVYTPVTAGMAVKANDIASLRLNLGDALLAVGRPAVSWSSGVSAGLPVQTLHIQQMRNVVK